MSKYLPFEFTPEYRKKFKTEMRIPVNFYSKHGQILIHKKQQATGDEIERLLKYASNGVYYDVDDTEKLRIKKDEAARTIDGLTYTKLISQKHAEKLSNTAEELFVDLKKVTLSEVHTRKTQKNMSELFSDFESQDDAMDGLINILEIMSKKENKNHGVELAVKRTITGMALKTRGMITQSSRDKKNNMLQVLNLMMSAFFCDVGYVRMQLPDNDELNDVQMNYIKQHPLMSYLLIAHDQTIKQEVKHTVLTHHRPRPTDENVNNYPYSKSLMKKLIELEMKFKKMPGKKAVADDIAQQIQLLKNNQIYNEDSNILAIVSEFASLTSDTAWRKAFSAEKSIKMIINNSFFTYTNRVLHEFLDYVSMSLNDNKKILNENDFIITASKSSKGDYFYEIDQIEEVGRYQSRPQVRRIGSITPKIKKSPKLHFEAFDIDNIKFDPRKARYNLLQDDSRQLAYIVDKEMYSDLHDFICDNISSPI